jgi:hypothetical protein
VLVAASGGSEGPYRVKAPYGKGPRWRNCPQCLSWDVLFLDEELVPFAPRTRSCASAMVVGQ